MGLKKKRAARAKHSPEVSAVRVLEARKAAKLRQMDVSYHANVSQRLVSELECGVAGDIQVSTLVRLCKALKVSPNFLLGWAAE